MDSMPSNIRWLYHLVAVWKCAYLYHFLVKGSEITRPKAFALRLVVGDLLQVLDSRCRCKEVAQRSSASASL